MAQAYISSISAPQFSCAFLYPCLVALLALGDCWEKNCIAGVSGNQGWGGFFSCVRVFFLVPAKLFVFCFAFRLAMKLLVAIPTCSLRVCVPALRGLLDVETLMPN